MESLGIEANSIKNYTHTISDSNQSIRLADLEGLELPIGRGGFLGCDAKSCASWISVSGQESAQELTLALKQYSGVTLVQPVADINKLIAKYRLWSIGFLFVAALVAGLILTLLLGTFMTVRVLLLPVGACTLSLALLGYLNGGYTIVNVLALFIVGGMALDFGIFLHLSAATSRPAVHLAIALSALSTLLAFGTLSLSSTPVIAGFGFSIGSGLLLAWLLSLIIVTPPAPTAEK
jgi:predicted exporter